MFVSCVNDYCTAASGTNQGSGARFRGGELYKELQKLLAERMDQLFEVRIAAVSGELALVSE